MWIHNLDPVLVHVGPIEIRYYGLVYVLGFLLVFWYFHSMRKKGLLELSSTDIETLLLYLMIGVLVGARIFHVIFWDLSYYLSNPLLILYVWQGGLSFHGGFVGVIAAVWLFCRKRKMSMLRIMDILTVPAALILALGRIANFINGELWGKVADSSKTWWCVNFKNTGGGDTCRHPYPLYESLSRFVIFAVLIPLYLRKFKEGFVAWSFILLFGVARFITDFWKEDPLFLQLTPGQWLSIGMILAGGYMLWKNHREELFSFTRKEKKTN